MLGSVSKTPVEKGSVVVLSNGQVCMLFEDCIANLTLGELFYANALENISAMYSSFDRYKQSLV